jgi:hypothetical protein
VQLYSLWRGYENKRASEENNNGAFKMFLPASRAAISLPAICRRLYELLLSRLLRLSPLAIVSFLLRAEYTLSNIIEILKF